MLIACPDCAAIQQMPPPPARGSLECWQCGHVLETATGRSLDGALACALATLLLLVPANLLPVMTVHLAGAEESTHLASGLLTAWQQGWPLLAIVLGLQGVVLPFVRFGLLSITLAAIRFGVRDGWVGPAFRLSEKLDVWAMADVLLIGAGIGYGRVATLIPVRIETGGWCFVAAALMTMVTRASLERRAVWQSLVTPPAQAGAGAIACTDCDLVLPPEAEGRRCPRCAAPIHRRRPFDLMRCTALVLACWILMPIAYGWPASEIWELGEPSPHTIIDGIALLFRNEFWPFGVILVVVSVIVPFAKLISVSWLLVSIRRRSSSRLRQRTRLYRVIDGVGRWSNLDPFTVMIFAPMVQFGQIAHIGIMVGSPVFLATVVLSMLATRVFDPRLMWDAAQAGGEAVPRHASGAGGPWWRAAQRWMARRRAAHGAGGGMTTHSHRGAAAGRRSGHRRRWRDGLRHVIGAFTGDHDLWSVSAGVAFYAWYAAIFGVVFLVSLYGLAADPQTVRAKIEGLSGALPAESVQFLAKQMQAVASAPNLQLSTSLGVSFLVVLWYARSAVATLIAALNTAFQTREKRGFLHLQVVTLTLTAGAAGFVTTAVAVALLVPAAAAAWIADPTVRDMISDARWPVLAILMWLALAILYRFAPCRGKPQWRWASGGALAATALWVLGSAGFSYIATNFSSNSVALGALSAVLIMQTWFYITAVVVLLGAILNAEAERPAIEGGAERQARRRTG